MFLWQVKLALLETRAGVALTQDLEGRPMLGELLRDTLWVRMTDFGGCWACWSSELEDAEGDTCFRLNAK